MVSSSICGSWAAHKACMLAVTLSSAKRGMSSGCSTWRCAMWCRPRLTGLLARAASKASSASRTARSPMACTCTPKPAMSSRAHLLGQVRGIHIGQPAVAALAAAAIQVGVDHPGGEVLRDTVLHDLHGAGPEPARLALLPPVEQVVQLVCAAAAIPPQGALDPGGERAVPGGGQVGRQRVRVAQVLPHDRVLPGGDAQRVQVLLGQQQPAELLGEGRAGHAAGPPAAPRPRAGCPAAHRPPRARSGRPGGRG